MPKTAEETNGRVGLSLTLEGLGSALCQNRSQQGTRCPICQALPCPRYFQPQETNALIPRADFCLLIFSNRSPRLLTMLPQPQGTTHPSSHLHELTYHVPCSCHAWLNSTDHPPQQGAPQQGKLSWSSHLPHPCLPKSALPTTSQLPAARGAPQRHVTHQSWGKHRAGRARPGDVSVRVRTKGAGVSREPSLAAPVPSKGPAFLRSFPWSTPKLGADRKQSQAVGRRFWRWVCELQVRMPSANENEGYGGAK